MGRFNNRTNGRGRGGGRTTRFTNRKENPKKKKTLEDYYFYVGSSKQASDFETIYEYLVDYIKRTYNRGNDIAESLRVMNLPSSSSAHFCSHTFSWSCSLQDLLDPYHISCSRVV